MKYIILMLIVFCSCKEKSSEHYMVVYDGYTMIPVDDFYRKVIGMDSIQLIIRQGKLEGNFCFPNEWEFRKWRKDTVYIHDTFISIDYSKIKWDGYHYYKK